MRPWSPTRHGWLPAAALTLTAADLDEIAAALTDSGAGAGPKHPTPPTAPSRHA